MKRYIKTKQDNDIPFDEIVVFLAMWLLSELFMFLCLNMAQEPIKPHRYKEIDADLVVTSTPTVTITPTPTPEVVYEHHLAEEPDFSALMYATEPLGRYYITAYNHLETGGKGTASGTTCHEGNITTCAADVPKYFHFGDYIEVGGRIYRVEDTGSAVKKRHIDIYFASYKEMARYGSNYQNIYKVTFPFGKPKD